MDIIEKKIILKQDFTKCEKRISASFLLNVESQVHG